MPTETFTAYDQGAHPPRDGRTNLRTLTTGVTYDIASEIDERNGWIEPGEERLVVVNEVRAAAAADGLSEIILFCFKGQRLDVAGKGMRTAIRRFVAICWMLKSNEMLGPNGKPMSLEKLSKQPHLRCTRCTLSLLAQEFGAQWGFRVRVQKKETTKPNYAHAAKHGWKKRRKRVADAARANKS